jgi:hypothetical protein
VSFWFEIVCSIGFGFEEKRTNRINNIWWGGGSTCFFEPLYCAGVINRVQFRGGSANSLFCAIKQFAVC